MMAVIAARPSLLMTSSMIVSLQPKLTGGRSTGWKLKTIFAFWHCIVPRQVLIAKIYLSSGIHGDEPAAPLAMCRLITENVWPENTALWISPCLNPTGFSANTRENAAGDDLNRDYKHLNTPEIRAHTQWLQTLPDMDFTIQLHEDWEAKGFYFYELKMGDQPTEPRRVLEAVKTVCPIDESTEIDGRKNDRGLIVPELDPRLRELWPEAFWLVMNKTQLSYTCEAPSDFQMQVRTEALVRAVRSLFD